MFQAIKDDIEKDLSLLEETNLVLLDKNKYWNFKNQLEEIKKRLEEYERDVLRMGITIDYNVPEDIKVDFAFISAKLEFFLKYGDGYKNILDYQVDLIKNNLQNIIAKLNFDNYLTINNELDDLLKLYSQSFNKALKTPEIKKIITHFKYQVLKYGLTLGIYDNTYDLTAFIPHVLDDYELIQKNQATAPWLKEELQKYTVDLTLIKNNFKKIMILIILGLTKNQITLEEGRKELNKKYYHPSDLEKEYTKPSLAIKKMAQDFSYTSLINGDYLNSDVKLILPILAQKSQWDWSTLAPIIEALNSNFQLNSEIVTYLAESLIVNLNYFNEGKGLNIYQEFKDNFQIFGDFNDDFNLAIIKYKNDIPKEILVHYTILTQNNYLINYLIQIDNEEYLTKELRDFAILHHNLPIIELCFKKGKFTPQEIEQLPSNYKVTYINNLLNNAKTPTEEQNILLKWYFKFSDNEILDYIIMQILKFSDFALIIKFLNGIVATTKYFPKESKFFEIIAKNPPALRNQIITYYEDCLRNNPYYERKFISPELITKKQENKGIFTSLDFQNMNIFEAIYVSSFIHKEYIKEFIKIFGNLNLDFTHLLKESTSLEITEKIELLKLSYIKDKEQFFKINRITFDLAKMMVEEIPRSLNDFLKYMQVEDIVNLSPTTLEIFAHDYEEEMHQKGLDLNAKLSQILSIGKHKDKVAYFTFIMHRGLFTPEILKSSFNLFIQDIGRNSKKSTYYWFIPRLIKNSPDYLHPALMRPFIIRGLNEELDWDMLLFYPDNQNNDPKIELQKRKYCGDLLKLIEVVPLSIKIAIIKIIAKSRIPEYLKYLLTNYSEYKDLILNETPDMDYNKLKL